VKPLEISRAPSQPWFLQHHLAQPDYDRDRGARAGRTGSPEVSAPASHGHVHFVLPFQKGFSGQVADGLVRWFTQCLNLFGWVWLVIRRRDRLLLWLIIRER